MKVLHLEGLPVDTGGVLSVLRNLQEASEALDLGLTHAVWVNSRYVETRTPALDYRYSRWALGEARSTPACSPASSRRSWRCGTC